jgi:hypothetical protein
VYKCSYTSQQAQCLTITKSTRFCCLLKWFELIVRIVPRIYKQCEGTRYRCVGTVDGYYCCVVDERFCVLCFLTDCGMHCRLSHSLPVTQYLFILCWVRWRGRVAPSVYRANYVCRNVWIVVALCWSWLESAESLRMAMSVLEWS